MADTDVPAKASETLELRMVTHVLMMQSQEIGDEEDHVAALARFSGLAFLPDGTVGSVEFVAATDYTNGPAASRFIPFLLSMTARSFAAGRLEPGQPTARRRDSPGPSRCWAARAASPAQRGTAH